jgi:hypothetical protein
MRGVLAVGVLLLAVLACSAREPAARYGQAADLAAYPQKTPKEALSSVLKAIDAKKIEYLVAQLADPDFVDERVKRVYGGKFEEQVEDTRARLDPSTVKLLKRFLIEGKWAEGKTTTVIRLEDEPKRVVHLSLKGDRWFLDHPSAAEKKTDN